jgi:hypothetical protein
MFDSIFESITDQVGDQFSKQLGLNKEQSAEALESTAEATMEVASSQLSAGNVGALMNLFSNKENDEGGNSIQTQIASAIVQKLDGKMGFTSSQIQGVIDIALPMVMKFIGAKNDETPDDDDSSLKDMFGGAAESFVRGKASGLLGKFF